MIRIDTRNFKRQAARLMDARRWPSAEKFWAAQAKGVMAEIVNLTPPGGGGVRGMAAKKRGEAAVEGDIAKLFRPAPPKTTGALASVDAVASAHDRARNRKGRVSRERGEKHPVLRPVLNEYRAAAKAKVGRLAGGFNRAAAKVGYKPPAWIWRHRSPGDVSLRVSARGIRFVAVNRVEFASSVDNLQKRIQTGVDAQAGKIRRQVDHLVKKASARSGFKGRRR